MNAYSIIEKEKLYTKNSEIKKATYTARLQSQ